MAEQLKTVSIAAPGFYGLNTQDASVQLDNGYALQAYNCVIDKYGRIGARKGWTAKNSSSGTLGANSVKALYELIGTDGSKYVLATGNNKLFKLVGSTLTEITYGGGGTAPTITASNWAIDALHGIAYFYQAGHDPLVFDPSVSTTTYKRISEASGYLGTVQQADVVLSAYGRIWNATSNTEKTIVQFSDVLAGQKFSGGTSGTLDISTVWTYGADEITGLAAHNGYLIIFGKRQILVYQGATDPNTMNLLEGINGVGCVARDSIQSISTDVLFLSDGGVRSFVRTIQEKSMPMRDISKNVRDELVALIPGEDPKNIKAEYYEKDAFYIISFPTSKITYCFDMRTALPDNSARATTWSLVPTAMFSTTDRQLLLGFTGYIGSYGGYTDNTISYHLAYYGNYIDFQTPTTIKILKRIGFTTVGGINQQIAIKWGFDYKSNYRGELISTGSQKVYEYGVAEYGIAEYTGGVNIDQKRINTHGTGNIIQFGFEADIYGQPLSFQKIDVYVKEGRVI
jgi:hypothetical protein